MRSYTSLSSASPSYICSTIQTAPLLGSNAVNAGRGPDSLRPRALKNVCPTRQEMQQRVCILVSPLPAPVRRATGPMTLGRRARHRTNHGRTPGGRTPGSIRYAGRTR